MSTETAPSDSNVNRAPELLVALWLTTAIAIIIFAARLYVRIRIIKYHGLDDYWIVASMILATVGISLETVSVKYGFGRHESSLSTEQIVEATKFNMVAIPPNLLSSATAKISVCFFLLHVNQDKRTGYFLYGMASLLFLFSIASSIVLLTQCQPVAALWNPALRMTGHCLDPSVNTDVALAQSVFFCLADVVFAIFPLSFLWNLKMNRRTKSALGFVLSLGLIAAAFGIVRCVVLQELSSRADILFSTVDLAIWSFLEQNVTIIAACIPVLYTVFRALLGNASTKASTGRATTSYAPRRAYDSYGTGSRVDRSNYREIDYEMHRPEWRTTVTGGRIETGSDDASSEERILPKATAGIVRTTEIGVD
ncbi:hypothetical protein VTN77DRAFT_2208 [Rasamsonia byssochlamydoides]|uniref:uncharacterized protein n=1 Tax=Rasamsonia byssochlamydoides TaxID=89139 RepID=UPI0037447BEC